MKEFISFFYLHYTVRHLTNMLEIIVCSTNHAQLIDYPQRLKNAEDLGLGILEFGQ